MHNAIQSMRLQTLIAVDMSDIDAQDDWRCDVIPARGTVEKAQSEAEGTLSFRTKRRQEWVPDGSLGDADTFSTVPSAGKTFNLDSGYTWTTHNSHVSAGQKIGPMQ